jgi:BirA family biotin operon repressor/biotin-[acetyl-CoA-carboxylase] ligase
MSVKLNAERIRAPISGLPREQLDLLEVFAEIESTNSYLMKQPAPKPGRFRVALAEHQTAGRGRMDRQWHSPGSTGVCLSMSYTFASEPKMLACATLAIGVGVAESLEKLGVRGIGLKWPNDLVLQDGKLGGILTEVQSRSGNIVTLVTGVGINFDLGNNADIHRISTRLGHVSDLASCMRELPSRSAVSTGLIEGLFNALAEFESQGFSSAAAAWEKYDWLRGQNISVEQANGLASGVCQGIDSDGALILRTASGTRRVTSGSVSFTGRTGGNP